MLESIRSGAQSFGVKVAFGIIILVFVFWGVGNFSDRDYSNVVAVVNGEPIVALEFEKAYHNAEEYLLRNNPGLTREELAKQRLGRQVLNELIQAALLAQEARRAGVAVDPLEMRAAVERIKAFQNERGQFDPEAYKRVLAARRMSPAQYEKELADDMLREKMFALITSAAWVDPDEAASRFNFLRERRVLAYLFLPASAHVAGIKISDAELQDYYDQNKASFAIPPRVDAAYIEVAPGALAPRETISAEKAREWYAANKSRFQRPEQVHAAHILVPLAQDADDAAVGAAVKILEDARAQINAGKDFAAVADAVNKEGAAEKGGDLGWLARGQTVPEFEEAVFALEPGKLSRPIRTPFGMHLAIVREKRAAGAAPFEDVADQVYEAVAFEEGSEKLHDALDTLIEDNILMKPLAESAARYGLKAAETGLADKAALLAKLHIKPESADALLATPAGAPLDTALEAGDNYIIARVLKAEPASTKPFAEVRDEIRNLLANEQALELALAEGAEILKKMAVESLAKARDQYKNIKESAPIERGGVPAGFQANERLGEDIFSAPVGKWLDRPLRAELADGVAGALLIHVDKLIPPAEGEYESVAEILGNAAKRERMEGLFEVFMGQLAKKAKIEIVNQNLIDRINM